MSEDKEEAWRAAKAAMKPHKQPSPCCGAVRVRSEKYDAYYCGSCHAWLERACTEPWCGYCAGRPEKAP